MMGIRRFYLVGRMGTQTGSLLCGFAVLARRLKGCSVHVTLEPCLVNECQLGRVFAAFFIIPPNDYFFNYTFKNIAIKFFKHIVLFQRSSELGNALFHGAFGFCRFLQIALLGLKLFDLACQIKIFALIGFLIQHFFQTHIDQLCPFCFQRPDVLFDFRQLLTGVAFRQGFFCSGNKFVQDILVILAKEFVRRYKCLLNRFLCYPLAVWAKLLAFFGTGDTLPDNLVILRTAVPASSC